MIKYFLEPVDNGIVKTIIDDNIDGAGKTKTEKKIYMLNDNISDTQKFLNDLISDLGLFTGNQHEKDILSLKVEYGNKYILSSEDVKLEKKALTSRLNELKKMNPEKKISNEAAIRD